MGTANRLTHTWTWYYDPNKLVITGEVSRIRTLTAYESRCFPDFSKTGQKFSEKVCWIKVLTFPTGALCVKHQLEWLQYTVSQYNCPTVLMAGTHSGEASVS